LDFFGHKPAVRAKQKIIALKGPMPQEIDEEAEAVRDQVLSDGYSASEALDDGDVAQQQHGLAQVNAWENVGLDDVSDADGQQDMFEQGGAVSPSMLKAPVTPVADSDEDAEIPSGSCKHPSSTPLTDERAKMQKMDDDPAIVPKSKAAKFESKVNQVADIEICHNDEMDEFTGDLENGFQHPDLEDEYIAQHGEGEGPPDVSPEKLQELDERAILDELEKLHRMEVIRPVILSPEEAAQENTVDTTLVFDWRFRGNA
jgi:hypothetical protein